MSRTVVDTDPEIILPPESKGVNGAEPATRNDWPVPDFQYNLGDHPLWQEFADILEANRQADIAEANRLADLELEELKSKK